MGKRSIAFNRSFTDPDEFQDPSFQLGAVDLRRAVYSTWVESESSACDRVGEAGEGCVVHRNPRERVERVGRPWRRKWGSYSDRPSEGSSSEPDPDRHHPLGQAETIKSPWTTESIFQGDGSVFSFNSGDSVSEVKVDVGEAQRMWTQNVMGVDPVNHEFSLHHSKLFRPWFPILRRENLQLRFPGEEKRHTSRLLALASSLVVFGRLARLQSFTQSDVRQT